MSRSFIDTLQASHIVGRVRASRHSALTWLADAKVVLPSYTTRHPQNEQILPSDLPLLILSGELGMLRVYDTHEAGKGDVSAISIASSGRVGSKPRQPSATFHLTSSSRKGHRG